MILIVIFSFNRAMQLDYLLRSILRKLISPDYEISVIYHTTGSHAEGYQKLINKYSAFKNIAFIERKSKILGISGYYPTLYSISNIKQFIKNTKFINNKCDNFKFILEKILKTTKCEFVMFNTDDGCFFDDIEIPQSILNMIKSDPLQTSYRLYVGENLDGFPAYINKTIKDYYKWNYYQNSSITHWTYPFAVDGTVYHTKSILHILRKVFYHNPITLESRVVSYVIKNKLLGTGLGPFNSVIIGTLLNRVSVNSNNPTIQISTDFLNKKFLEGYELELELPNEIRNVNIVPDKVFIINSEKSKETIYSCDEKGKKIMDLFDISGAKFD